MDFVALSQECAPWVAHETMAAIIKTESAFRPLAIGVNGGFKLARQPETKAEAVATAKWLIASGYNIDLGLGQVNSSNLAKTGLTVEDAFEPCKNVAAAAKILHWNYQAATRRIPGEQAALHAALSAYNTGSFSRGFANGYVQKVLNNSRSASAVPALVSVPASRAKTIKVPEKPVSQAKSESLVEHSSQGLGSTVYSEGAPQQHNVMVY